MTRQLRHEETKARLARLGFDVSKYRLLDTRIDDPPAKHSESLDDYYRAPLPLDALYAEVFGREALDEINARRPRDRAGVR